MLGLECSIRYKLNRPCSLDPHFDELISSQRERLCMNKIEDNNHNFVNIGEEIYTAANKLQ